MEKDDKTFDLAALEEGQESLSEDESSDLTPVTGQEEVRIIPDENTPSNEAQIRETDSGTRDGESSLTDEIGATGRTTTIRNDSSTSVSTVSVSGSQFSSRPSLDGLTLSEVNDRVSRGLTNADEKGGRSTGQIVRENTLTFFNIILGTLITILFVLAIVDNDPGHAQDGLFVGIVVLANVAVGTIQEIRAARTLRSLIALTSPRATVVRDGDETVIPSDQVVKDDLISLSSGDQVVADGHIVANWAEIDESLLTGESTSIRRDVGDELRSGSFVTAGSCYYRAERIGREAYAQKLTSDARKVVRRETLLQIRFRRILRMLLIATAILGTLLLISSSIGDDDLAEAIKATTATISSVVPEGLLLGMTVAFAVGAVRLSRRGAIVQDINSVEAMNYVDVVCLDKTGTITANKLSLHEVKWISDEDTLLPWFGAFAQASSAESRTVQAIADGLSETTNNAESADRIPFNSERRWSALRMRLGVDEHIFVLGAPETILPFCTGQDEEVEEIRASYQAASGVGLRGVLLAEAEVFPNVDIGLKSLKLRALITVSDSLRPEVAEAFAKMQELEIQPKIISGDNPDTVMALVRQLGISLKGPTVSGTELAAMEEDVFRETVESSSVFGRVEPYQKAKIVSALRENGHFVAMVGDGANDVQALRESDVAVAMESGTQTARAVAGIVLLNDSFAAFVFSTAEAQAVLGNSVQLSKLFIAKSFYAFLIIIASELLGLDFPFLPRHGSLTALFTLGIPSLFIAATTPPRSAGHDFTNSVLRFALPASLALAAASVAVHLLAQGFLDRPIEDSRTLVSLTIGIVGIYFMVQVIGYDGFHQSRQLKNLRRPILTTFFGIVLLALFLLTIYTPWLRSFFDFGPIGVGEWSIVVPAVVGAMVGQYVISRYWREIIAWIVKQPSEDMLNRGRAV